VVVPHYSPGGGQSWWVEVKTVGAVKWSYGRRNPIRHSDSSVVVWCTARTGRRPPFVRILGWAAVADIDGDGTDTPMRPVAEIDAWFRRDWFAS